MSEFTPRFLKDYQSPHYAISTVHLTVELDEHATIVTNVMTISRNGDHDHPLVLDGEHLKLLSVNIEGRPLESDFYQLDDTSLAFHIAQLDDQDSVQVSIVTEIDPKGNTALEGIYKSGDVYCSQCEAEGFRRITYFLDRPDAMAVYTTKIIAAKQDFPYLLANGNKVATGDLDNGLHFVTWHDPYPKPCYLFALVAGDFDLLADSFTTKSGRDVNLELFVDKGNLNKAEHAMISLKKSMQWDEEQFNLEYDLDIYMIVAVDFFNMGAMENKGLNIFNSKYVLADDLSATDDDFFGIESVIAHEYFHNWTGNRVTCRDWFQLSLKEGLTVFRDQQFSADMHSKAVTRIKNVRVVRSQQFAEDAGPMAHPIRPEKVVEMNNFYTLTVYEKGSEVIRMLHTLLGDKGFKEGIKLYFHRFDGQAVTCDDFVNALSDATGKDLSQFKRWYSQSGTPHLEVSDRFDEEKGRYYLTIKQNHPQTQDNQQKHNLHIPINFELINAKNNESFKQGMLELCEEEQTWSFSHIKQRPVPALLGNFSAPVKLDYDYTDAQILALILGANDEFIRWDAGQKLFATYIRQLVVDKDLPLPSNIIDIVHRILDSDADNAFKAEQLTLPSFDEMADSIDKVDVSALVNAISTLKHYIAKHCQIKMQQVYQQCQSDEFLKDGQAIGDRALKNICLDYLTTVADDALVEQQYDAANNMTDQIAALKIAAQFDLPCFERLSTSFEQQWTDNTLVMDKWFSINAMHNHDSVIERVTSLLVHPKFSLENPNRARSLIGAFAFYNPKYFHQIDGKGYQFLAEQIAKLNQINPQVASRIITPLIGFKSFNEQHQQLMMAQLEALHKLENLSKDLSEKLDAALKS